MKRDLQQKVKEHIDSVIPLQIYPSEHWFTARGSEVDPKVEAQNFLDHERKKKFHPFFYFDRGVVDRDLCMLYSSQKYKFCDLCEKFFHPSLGLGTKCSKECKDSSKERMKSRLRISRSQYNPRDPKQYSERHGLGILDAEEKIKEFCRSPLSISFWVERGFAIEDAKQIISESQAIRSPLSMIYWTSRGFSEAESIEEISKEQSKRSASKKGKVSRDSLWICPEFWEKRGFSSEETKIQIEEKKRQMASSISSTWQQKTELERKQAHPGCLEFYTQRGFSEEHAVNKIKENLSKRTSGKFVSLISQEFCRSLSAHFSGDKLYYHELSKEFSSWDHLNKKIYFYDFVNTTRKFCVEFHGDYWHQPGDPHDKRKQEVLEQRGFSIYVVWESDYNSDKEQCIKNLIERIRNENCKN